MADAATTSSLATLDWIVVIGYLVVSIIIGAWSMRQITDAGAFLMARRKLGKLLSLSAAFAGNVNANDPITVTSKVYKDGISGIWSTLNFLLLTPWFWIRDPVGRRLRMVTGIDVWYHRFGPFLANFKLMTDILLGPINIGLGILAAAKVTLVVSGRHFVGPEGWLGMSQDTADMVLATGLVVVPTMIYTVMGGIIAAYATDVFMSVLIVVLSFVVVPYLWTSIGGAAAIGQCVPENHWELFATKTTADFSVIGIIWFCMVWIISLPPGPTGVKDEMTARIGGLGLILKRFCTLGWAAIGLFGLVYLVQQGRTEKPDDIFAIVSSELLPTGLRGVLVAAVLAAAMSTIASMAIGFAGVSLHNLYRPWFAPRASSGHYLFAVRVLSVVGLGLAWLVAVVNSQKPIFEYFTAMAILGASLGVPYLAAFLWRRVTTTGAIAAMIIGLITGVINLVSNDLSQPWWWGVDFIRQGWVAYLGWWQSVYQAVATVIDWQWLGLTKVQLALTADGLVKGAPVAIIMPATMVPSIAAMVGLSLLTRQHSERSVFEFYARLDTPVGEEHRLVAQGIKVDLLQDLGSDADVTTRDPSRRLLFLDLFYLPKLLWTGQVKLSDYKVDLIGIAATTAFVAAFISGVFALIAWLRP